MRRYPPPVAVGLAAFFGLAGCTSPPQVILVSARGLGWTMVASDLDAATNTAPPWLGLADATCRPLSPLPAGETGPSLATLETGVFPAVHRVPANTFLPFAAATAGDPFPLSESEPVSAADAGLAVPTLAEHAARAGRRSVRIGSLFTLPTRPGVSSLLQPREGQARGDHELVARMVAAHGQPPPAVDLSAATAALAAGDQATADRVMAAVRAESKWLLDATLMVLASPPTPALVVLDLPLLDRIGHAFGISPSTAPTRSPRPGGSTRGSDAVETLPVPHPSDHFWQLGRDTLGEALAALRGSAPQATIIVASGYSFTPIRGRVLLDRIGIPATPAPRIVPSSTTASLFWPPGIDPEIRNATRSALLAARDPHDGTPLVDRVLAGAELDAAGIFPPGETPDAWIQLAPGYTAGLAQPGELDWLGSPRFVADHGFRPTGNADLGVLCATGNPARSALRRLQPQPAPPPAPLSAVTPARLAAALLAVDLPEAH